MESIEESLINLIKYRIFFRIAIDNYDEINILLRERGDLGAITDDDVDFCCIKNAEIQRKAIIVVIFCHTTLESFINFYAAENLSNNYLKDYIDQLNIKSKWVIVPKLVINDEINRGSKGFQLFGELIALRNKLMHDKPKKKKIYEIENSEFIQEEEASKAIEAVKEMLKELKRIDKSVDIDWLETVKNDPFL